VLVKVDDAIYEKCSGLKTIQRKIEKIFSSKALKNSTKILVSNESTKKIVTEHYKIASKNIEVVPNGVDISFFKSKSNEREPWIVFSGVMYYHRGLDVLIEAAPLILKSMPDARFILLGEGPEIESLKQKVKELKISTNVDFKGWVEREKIPSFLTKSSVGIGPLKLTDVTSKALPIKVLEYMASSLPIIAAKDTLPEDVLKDKHNGYFVKDVNDLAKKIIYLLQNEEIRKKFGNNSKEMVTRFDWKNIVKMILNEYKKIE